MKIQENIPLAAYTTFKIGGPARFFCTVSDEDDLFFAVGFAKKKGLPVFVLGGGSNILVSDSGFSGLAIKMETKGVGYRTEGDSTIVSAGTGELWDELVAQTVERGLYGLENLSAIPGTVGAAPVQNIGAYGVEVGRLVHGIRALDTKSMEFVEMTNRDCHFGYRNSAFKFEKGRYVVARVDFKLTEKGKINTEYKDVREYFVSRGVAEPTLSQVRDAVIDIRWNKLPDWKLWGTAGSYFKNVVVTSAKYEELKTKYPDLPSFPEPEGKVKVPLGWILDKICDVKGLQIGKAKVYEKQALVLLAMPGATAAEVVELSHELMRRVKEKTGIEIEGEVEWVN